MKKCKSYDYKIERKYTYQPITGTPIGYDVKTPICNGTRERDECSCGGDMSKCDFYPEVRRRIMKMEGATMRVRVNLDTMKSINDFVSICSKLDCKVNLVDGNDYCVSAKSLVGAIATMDWNQVFVESEKDIYTYIQDFIAE